jgi:hypothetical protein
VIAETSFHSRGYTERLVNAAEIVIHKPKGDGSGVILDLLGESVRQAGKAPDAHPHEIALLAGRAFALADGHWIVFPCRYRRSIMGSLSMMRNSRWHRSQVNLPTSIESKSRGSLAHF